MSLYRQRKVGTRVPRKTILIVCEGQRTEPNYFEGFKIGHVRVVGSGYNTLSVVKEAIRIHENDGPFDIVWCVFDRDSFPKSRVNSALQLATNRGFNVAFSNESFELWYVLHFQYLVSKLNRSQYIVLLKGHLGTYEKNDPLIYGKMIKHMHTALSNARKLDKLYYSQLLVDRCPYTNVHELVEWLNSRRR